jgi:hypothetical protein
LINKDIIRYQKQRKYNLNIDVVVKFLPREFALMLATVIFYVKPVEAEFSSQVHGTNPHQTREFLFTVDGDPIQAESMNEIMSETFAQYGLVIHMSDFRHALEAFTHKLGKGSGDGLYDPFLSRTANHNTATSASYGRDENTIDGIPADVTEGNFERQADAPCNLFLYTVPNSRVCAAASDGTLSYWEGHAETYN